MYRREKSINLKGSSSLLCNNLTAFINSEKGSLNYAVVHKYLINMVSSSTDGSQVTNKQVICKDPSSTQQGGTMIMQAKWVSLPSRTVLVLTSLKGIQMFEYDGSAMLYWHALTDVNTTTDNADQSNFGRGIVSVGESFICVGTQNGQILVFNIPQKGTNVTFKETLSAHSSAICDLAASGNDMVTSDDGGNIIMWRVSGSNIQQTGTAIKGFGEPCCCVGIWNDIIVGAYANGKVKVYSTSGKLGAEVNAHARTINAMSIAKDSGLVLTASEDTFVRVWQLKRGPVPGVEFKFADKVTDLQLVGAQFVLDNGRAFGVTGYDSPELIFYIQ